MTTILVADPRQAFQTQLEQAAEDYGFATRGQPDIVLTPDAATAKFWSRKRIPVVVYEYGAVLDIGELMVAVFALLEEE